MPLNVTATLPPGAPDELRFPDNRPISSVPHGELYTEMNRLKIPGYSARNGRTDNEAAYQAHLRAIHDDAGRAAVAEWLQANKIK